MAQPAAPVVRGKRGPLPAGAPKLGATGSKLGATYVCGSKPLAFGEHTLTAGVEVPGAAAWTRLEAWTGARRVRKIEPGEKYVSFLEFTGRTYEAHVESQRREAERLTAASE